VAPVVSNATAQETSSVDLCELLAATAPVSEAHTAASKSAPAATSSSSSKPAPPPILTVPELQEQQQPEYSQHHQQHWIPRAMPAQLSPAAAAAGRMLMQPCMAAAAANCSGALSPPANVAGVRAAAALLGSGESTPECLSPVTKSTAAIRDHGAALEAAVWASRLH
jgi:hypothetical protein